MRLRLLGASAALVSVMVGMTGPAAADPELETKRDQVSRDIEQLRHELAETSHQLVAAVVALREAEAHLPGARAVLERAREELAAAQARDQQARRELEVAEDAERLAEDGLADVNAGILEHRDAVGRVARSAYATGGLSGGYGELAVVLEATSPDELATRISSVQSIVKAENGALERLARDRADRASAQARLESVRLEVAQARERTRQQLELTLAAERKASEAESEVRRLVDARAAAVAAVEAERVAEEQRIAALEAERAAIERELQQRAALARAAGVSSDGGAAGALARPAPGEVTSPFGMRKHPITGRQRMHDGMDFRGACGSPIAAAGAGTVIWATWRGGYGYQLAIDHGVLAGRHLVTSYSHLPEGGFAVSAGARVERGQQVGQVGTTGASTGCHLHFSVFVNGKVSNPAAWL